MAHTPHTYSDVELPALLNTALALYQELATILYAIQEKTGIPGMHTDINSDDDTPGVFERLELMQEADEADRNLLLFISFDTEE